MDEQGEPGARTEIDVLRERNQQLEQTLKLSREATDARLAELELKAEAIRAGIIDIDGLKLADRAGMRVDENGVVHGAGQAMAKLRRDKPWLFGNSTTSSVSPVPATTPTRLRLATEMTLDEWRAARAELLQRR